MSLICSGAVLELNSNIRCIEISTIDLEDIGFGELNSNIRCIEIIITGYR